MSDKKALPKKLKRVFQPPGTRKMAKYRSLEIHLKHSPQDTAAAKLHRELGRELKID